MENLNIDFNTLSSSIKDWGLELGFDAVGITDTKLEEAEHYLNQWISKGYHGEMTWMEKHGNKRTNPEKLIPNTIRVISVRMDYRPDEPDPIDILKDPAAAFISRYALGRDYHKVLRSKLQKLAMRIQKDIGPFGYRAFVDSAPVMEKALAEKAGLGWIGKHSNLVNKDAGSWFFLGELYTDLPLPIDKPVGDHCGKCQNCLDVCPTNAIIGPYQVDARRCISYLTIELEGPIPEEFRPLIGNRVYGCDDCQQHCPWNSFSNPTNESDFSPRNNLDKATLLELFDWSETEFLKRTEGSSIRRIGYERWQRNLVIALGNSESNKEIVKTLESKKEDCSSMIREHIEWALHQQNTKGQKVRKRSL